MRLFAPYYYGKHKWDNYLLDIQGAIKTDKATHSKTASAPQRRSMPQMRRSWRSYASKPSKCGA